jgi:type VI secretion system secreted protein VgrG
LLRKHGFTGSDFVFKLTREYQAFEYVTQFCESDLAFIQRLLAQEGIYFAFEQGKNSEQLIFADNLEGYVRENLKFVAFRANSGLESAAQESVHALDIAHLTMLKKTQLKNYNYRDSNAPLLVEYGFNGDTKATNGVNFQWGDSDFRTQKQGQLLAKIRQERSIAAQCYANGRGDVMLTRPGEVLRLNGHSAIEAPHG